MENFIKIEWESSRGKGYAMIILDEFFPASQKKIKTLLKTINLDWFHRDELIARLKEYFQNKIAECDTEQKANTKEYFQWKQAKADCMIRISTKKKANGIPLTEDELKAEKEAKKNYQAAIVYHRNAAKGYERKKKQLEQNQEFLLKSL